MNDLGLSTNRGLIGTSKKSSDECKPSVRGPNQDFFPNVVVETHDGQKALFYDDLLRNKTVLINRTSIRDKDCPVTANLLKVQQLLGNSLGNEVLIYSIVSDPERENAATLRQFAEQNGVRQGWWFVTGKPEAIEAIRGRLFGHVHKENASATEDCSMMMLRYGNEKLGIWGSIPGIVSPEQIVMRLSWLQPKAAHVGPSKRKGPFPQHDV